ncbi:hypothetical protein AB0L88_23215 [Saccharopolyspora shandongensis]|uniref:hypothetical protein n=1 Tax=Saccharopolyspora shandongensis TaxID=418495 RepID=UPI0034359356
MSYEVRAETGLVSAVATRFTEDHPADVDKAKLAVARQAGESDLGWAVAAANSMCVYTWEVRLRQLGRDAEAAANGVAAAMGVYVASGRTAADELRRNAQWLEEA